MSTTKITESKRKRIFKRDNGECQICHKKLNLHSDYFAAVLDNNTATIDHIIPRSLGGTNADSNLRVLCRKCNVSRGNRTGAPLVNNIKKSLNVYIDSNKVEKIANEIDLGIINENDIFEIEETLQVTYLKNLKAIGELKKLIRLKEGE